VLGVEKNATPEVIKRAYFGKVRQYPPERFPEEFKELRAAYDTLSDAKKRAEYDETGALPEAILPLLHQARNASDRDQHAKAAECYETILCLHPELGKIRQEYAQTLEDGGKPGKATEVWEHLCAQCPTNAEYAVALAESYGHRGWGKKALAQYQRALDLDKSNSDSWLALIRYHLDAHEQDEAKALCREALDTMGEKASCGIHLCAFMLFEAGDKAFAEACLQHMIRTAKEAPLDEDDFERALSLVLTRVEAEESIHLFPYVKELAALLPRMDDDLRERLGWAERNYDITTIESKGFDSLFHDILVIQNNEDTTPKTQNHLISMEYILLAKKDKYSPLLKRLQAEYPDLYDLHKTFFDEALTTTNPASMMRQRKKALGKSHLRLVEYLEGEEDDDDDWEPVETVRRETPKVGRNDPCPCGSGKKYKKCCGA
jgi:tetratricopeptide (TPR) repeat protein